MNLGVAMQRWRAAFAFACMLSAVPAPARAQQALAPAKAGYLGVELHSFTREEAQAEDKYPAQIVPQLGHSDIVYSVAVAPDGRTVLTSGGDKTLRLWDLASGREIRVFKGHTGKTWAVAISPDGKTALSGSSDNTMRLWDLASGREVRKFEGHMAEVRAVAFSPDGQNALSGSGDQTVRLWDLRSGSEIKKFTGRSGWINSVAYSPDGKTALSCSQNGSIMLWDLAAGREIKTIEDPGGWVNSVAFLPDGKTALSGGFSKALKLWHLESGHEIKQFKGHADEVRFVAISSDGAAALSGGYDNAVRLWDLASGLETGKFEGHSDHVTSVAFTPDGKTAASGSLDRTLRFWDLTSGREIRKLRGQAVQPDAVAYSPDGKTALVGNWDHTLILWDLTSGREIKRFEGHSGEVPAVVFSPDGKTVLSASADQTVRIWDLKTGRESRKFQGHTGEVYTVAVSPDGKTVLSGGRDNALRLWDLKSGREIKKFVEHTGRVWAVAFSPDGTIALSDHGDGSLRLWNLTGGREIRRLEGGTHNARAVAFSPDGKTALSGSGGLDFTLKLWDLESGSEIEKFAGHSDAVNSVAFAPDGKTALSGGFDRVLRLWDLKSGRAIREFKGHSDTVWKVAIAPDGKTALSASIDGAVRLWSLESGEALASLSSSRDGAYLSITPQGFFTASRRDTDLLAIVRGFEITTIGQGYQSLFNPDLLREALAGDPDGEVKRAARVISLEKVLDAGPPPVAAITSHAPNSRSRQDVVIVTARITDRGKGIGRIEWRVNGVTVGVMAKPAGPGPDYDVERELALDPGENQIETIAYDGRNLLASLPTLATITYDGPADTVKPKLHILTIGVNAYADQGWTPPGSKDKLAFPPLNLAVADAKAFGAKMQKAGAGLYAEVRVTEALDADATPAKLDALIGKMAAGITPRDTFVFYAAAHGYSLNGHYYLIPQDYQGGTNPQALASRAINQERLQDWIANRIRAKKAVILLDTCESGALVGGYTKSRTDTPASEAAIGRLHEATGRPVLTAAATGKPAFEGYKGHGVFTYALIEALQQGDANNNGRIEITELAAHVAKRVPELAAEVDKYGVVKGIAVTAMRGASRDKQSAHFGSIGEDFALVERQP